MPPYALFRWAVAARLCGARLWFISTGAGPINRRLSRWMLTYVARAACYRSYRDTNSKDFLASLGIDTRGEEIYPDLAFKLAVPSVPTIGVPEASPVTIAVGLIDYNGWYGHARPGDTIYEAYLAKMTRFVGDLLERGYRVRLLVGEIADERAVAGLRTALTEQGYASAFDAVRASGSGQVVVEPVHNLDNLMHQMADTALVVASRFHNVVCALKMARPTISVGYEAKNEFVMRQFGQWAFCHHIEYFDGTQLLRQVEEQLSNRALRENAIRQKPSEFHARIAEQERVLAGIL